MKIVKERQVQNKYQHSYQQVVDKLCIFSTCGGLRMNVKGGWGGGCESGVLEIILWRHGFRSPINHNVLSDKE